jgi:hypothetical protein
VLVGAGFPAPDLSAPVKSLNVLRRQRLTFGNRSSVVCLPDRPPALATASMSRRQEVIFPRFQRFTRGSTPAARPRPQQGAAPLSSGLPELMVAHLTHLPEPEAVDRVALTIRFLNNGLACWERDSQAGAGGITPLAPFTLVLTDLAVAMLDAPSSVPPQPPSPVVPGPLRSAAVAPLIAGRNLLDTGATATFIEPRIQGYKEWRRHRSYPPRTGAPRGDLAELVPGKTARCDAAARRNDTRQTWSDARTRSSACGPPRSRGVK